MAARNDELGHEERQGEPGAGCRDWGKSPRSPPHPSGEPAQAEESDDVKDLRAVKIPRHVPRNSRCPAVWQAPEGWWQVAGLDQVDRVAPQEKIGSNDSPNPGPIAAVLVAKSQVEAGVPTYECSIGCRIMDSLSGSID